MRYRFSVWAFTGAIAAAPSAGIACARTPQPASVEPSPAPGAGELGLAGAGEGGRGEGWGGGGTPRDSQNDGTASLREGPTQVHGGLPPEIIQRIVQHSFGRVRLCYEDALRKTPALRGRVVVRFVIDRAGGVSEASDGGSDLPDRAVVTCVVRVFSDLSFPMPEGGLVTVVYPILFEHGKAQPARRPGASARRARFLHQRPPRKAALSPIGA